ncbi:MAG: hypothetical protein JNK47_20515 [Mesorhizobium sp.]|nr:hypothetical protein [Mesorhizobium sp.]MBL8579596.1 hypothetical protein [Mesorhizobium sp.]
MTSRPSKFCLRLAIAGAALAATLGSGSAFDDPGAGTIVPQGEMPEFCQKAAAARYEVDLLAITTDPAVERDGKFLVLGTVQGENREMGIDCRFEPNGAFIDIIEAPAMND